MEKISIRTISREINELKISLSFEHVALFILNFRDRFATHKQNDSRGSFIHFFAFFQARRRKNETIFSLFVFTNYNKIYIEKRDEFYLEIFLINMTYEQKMETNDKFFSENFTFFCQFRNKIRPTWE